MCGFAALLGTRNTPVDPALLARMGATIAHRGPDDQGTWCDSQVGLVFRRLSIIDLSAAGHQPMQSENGDFTLAFNGEIYNYRELRTELVALGHRFRGASDTEVLLRAYMQWGSACVERLNGMFSFLVHDRRRDIVFGARDRFGIKPLYVAQTPHGLGFASEIKALRAIGAGTTPNWSRVAEWLTGPSLDQIDARGRTFFAGIEEIAPATAIEVSAAGQMRQWKYWTISGRQRDSSPRPDAAEEFAALFEDSVRLQARADVPLGVSLSGGLDSTAITCALARVTGTTLEAFCYMSSEHDELEYINATLAQTGARLNVVDVTPELLFDSLPTVLAAHDEPIHTLTAVIGYEIMGAARARGIKVLLSGQGADEVLAGYPSYFPMHWANLVRQGSIDVAREEIVRWTAAHGGDVEVMVAAARRRAFRLSLHDNVPLYSTASRMAQWIGRRRQPGFSPELLRHLSISDTDPVGLTDLSHALDQSIHCAPLPMYLRVEDRNGMAHGVEGRVPFLDHRLVELAFSLPEGWLLSGPFNKYVLRESLKGRAPEIVHRRLDKMGFPHSGSAWFRGPLAERTADLLARPVASDLYDAAWARQLLAQHRSGTHDHKQLLVKLVQLEQWMRVVVNADTRPGNRLAAEPVSATVNAA